MNIQSINNILLVEKIKIKEVQKIIEDISNTINNNNTSIYSPITIHILEHTIQNKYLNKYNTINKEANKFNIKLNTNKNINIQISTLEKNFYKCCYNSEKFIANNFFVKYYNLLGLLKYEIAYLEYKYYKYML